MNALVLMLGTLTALPVPAPTTVDRRTSGRAMLLTPVGGLVLAVPLVLLALLDAPAGLLATLLVALLAVLTRGLHLDGLADTADGLGSGRRGEAALAVMRQSDIGPFGVVTLVLALLAQVAALAVCLAAGAGPAVLLVALVASRGVLPVLCTPAFPAARRDGLGRGFAGAVPVVPAALSLLAGLAVAVGGALLLSSGSLPGTDDVGPVPVLLPALAPLAGLGLAWHARRRFGGVTGDVYGAAVEVTFTLALVLAALAL